MKVKSHLAGILTSLALAGLQFIRATPLFAADNVVKEFDAGFGPNSVGVVDAGEDTEIAGPQAIYAGDDGAIYLLDQVNSRVVGFDAKEPGARTRSLALPENMEPTDLIVAKGNIYVWDGKPISLEASDGGLSRSVTPGGGALAPDNTALSMFGQMGSEQLPEDASGTRSLTPGPGRLVGRQLVATHGKGPITADVTRDKNETAAQVDVRQQGAATLLAKLLRDVLGEHKHTALMVDVEKLNRAEFVANLELPSTFVARFSPSGALEGVYELPLTPSVALSRRFVTISPDGDVYFLRTRKGVVDVIGVGFRLMKNAKVIDVRGPAPNYADIAKDRKGAIAAVRPLTRARVPDTARDFADKPWPLNARSYGPDPDTRCSGFNRIRRPGYLIGRVGQEVRGIPYCWGCQGFFDQIVNKIKRGTLAGNVCTRNNPRYDEGAINPFPSRRSLSNPWDLKPGDALNKPGSDVMLFIGFTPDRKAEVLEASPGGCNGRVCHNVYPLAALLARGYEPRRFRALLN